MPTCITMNFKIHSPVRVLQSCNMDGKMCTLPSGKPEWLRLFRVLHVMINGWTSVPVQSVLPSCSRHFVVLSGLHEEVDYSEKLKFSDDEDEHGDKNKMW